MLPLFLFLGVSAFIEENEKVLHSCAELLLEKEKITREEFEALFDSADCI